MPLPKGFEAQLFRTADELRAGSKLTPAEYQLPVLALLFLKYADEGFAKAHATLNARRRRGAPEPEDYRAEGAVYLRPEHRWGALVKLPDDADLGKILNEAVRAVEEDNDSLRGVFPRDYNRIDKTILRDLLKALNTLEESPEGDVYGRVYEYFLGAFAPGTLQKGGEYFTPFSVVRLIVAVLEPYGGRILDPACGSGGMFVQSARFVAEHKGSKALSIFGQEKTRQTIQLCRMNLAVHGLQGTVKEVTSSLYEFPVEKEVKEGFDFVMSNPPFNLKGVDKERIKDDRARYPWGMPSGDNANYLWIQRFYSALNDTGRAGFVMANSASDAGGRDMDVRRELVKSGAVDVIVTLTPNLFYTVTLPVTLWFFDRAKSKGARADEVLFIDAREVYEQVDRAHRTLTPAQVEFLANIVRLWRGRAAEDHSGGLALTTERVGASYRDVEGLCKRVSRKAIEENRWSLNPGRYVGVGAKVGAEEIDFEERLMELQEEFETLTAEAHALEERVAENMSLLLGRR
ncbi:MAG: class I SAM-dependent DNA methyltransferase [Polyangiales bacterium]